MNLSHLQHIFREYDIRGEVPGELNPAVVQCIARGFAQDVARRLGIARPTISLGWDGRHSSPDLQRAVAQGLSEGGANVAVVGLGPTPLVYYSVFTLPTDGCVMITGSHNPPEYNGLKLMLGKKPYFGEQIQALYAQLAHDVPLAAIPGEIQQQDVKTPYIDMLVETAGALREDMRVVWDAGSGAAGEVIQAVAARLPGTHEVLYGEIDGDFPHHHPDPSVEKNMADLRKRVLETNADIGIAFDGDGDRIGVIDNRGRMWAGDQLLAVCARGVLQDLPGATIIADVKTSQGVFDAIAAAGGKGLMWKTGHSNIKSKLMETGAPLAGEMSGHMFFADRYFGFDDALYAAMRLLSQLSQLSKPASDMVDALPVWQSTPEMRIACADEHKFQLIDALAAQLTQEGLEFCAIDGVRLTAPQGWWLLRASNTQPVLVARVEARSPADLELLTEQLRKRLSAFGIVL